MSARRGHFHAKVEATFFCDRGCRYDGMFGKILPSAFVHEDRKRILAVRFEEIFLECRGALGGRMSTESRADARKTDRNAAAFFVNTKRVDDRTFGCEAMGQ